MSALRVVIAGDHRGAGAMRDAQDYVRQLGHSAEIAWEPEGRNSDYPDPAYVVAGEILAGRADLGILFCGTGVGTCIAANKMRGIRAALVHDEITAEICRSHNDANIICLSAEMLGQGMIRRIVEATLRTGFEGGRHARRLRKVEAMERGEDPRQITE